MHSSRKLASLALLNACGILLSACGSMDPRDAAKPDSKQAGQGPRVVREASTGSRLPGGASANTVHTLGADDAKEAMRNAPPNPGGKVF